MEIKGQDVASAFQEFEIYSPNFSFHSAEFAKSQKLFRLEDNFVLRHMLYELPDSYIVLENGKLYQSTTFWKKVFFER